MVENPLRELLWLVIFMSFPKGKGEFWLLVERKSKKMTKMSAKEKRKEQAITDIIAQFAEVLDVNASVRLWNGKLLPLGKEVTSDLALTISDPGVISSLLHWPTLDHLIRQYAHGNIDLEGGTIVDFGELFQKTSSRKKFKALRRRELLKNSLPFMFSRGTKAGISREFLGDEIGERRDQVDNTAYISFHYDLNNDFYKLFLDKEMVYTCGYFQKPTNSLDQAQFDKLDMICKKLRLKEGDRFLDIGCGWGALVCHAAEHYGVKAYGISLSVDQLEYARHKIKAKGLSDKVAVDFLDYMDLKGEFDKISSIGMYEAIGVPNIPDYLQIIQSVLAKDGLFLNHGITRRAKKKKKSFNARPEQRALQKYIFPGGELDDLGNTLQLLEHQGFEINDVEGWREHYALTTRHWCERLTANRAEAEALVGAEAYRIWVAYLGGVTLSFQRGSARIYQVLCTKSAKGKSPLPLTRKDLYS